MRERLTKLLARFDALSIRERLLIMAVILVLIFVLWDSLLMQPLNLQQKTANEQITNTEQRLHSLNATITSLVTASQHDPNAVLRQQISTAALQTAALDKQLASATVGLISPDQMPQILETVLAKQSRLKLLQVRSLPARPLLKLPKGETSTSNVYAHGFELQFQGSFSDTLTYLRALRTLPWHFYWDSLDVKVDRYPRNTVTLIVHTLGLREGWIGV